MFSITIIILTEQKLEYNELAYSVDMSCLILVISVRLTNAFSLQSYSCTLPRNWPLNISRYQFNGRQLASVDGPFMLIAAYKSGHNIRLIPLFRSGDAVVLTIKM